MVHSVFNMPLSCRGVILFYIITYKNLKVNNYRLFNSSLNFATKVVSPKIVMFSFAFLHPYLLVYSDKNPCIKEDVTDIDSMGNAIISLVCSVIRYIFINLFHRLLP